MEGAATGMPKMLRYSGVKPRGFASRFRRWQVFPQTSYQNYNQNDIIRFNFQTEAFIDPYSSYIEIEITFNPNDYGGLNRGNYTNGSKPAFMLDGPSTSIINQLVLYSNSKEIERVQEYDSLGNILADLGVPVAARVSKAYEGYQYDRVFANANSNTQISGSVGGVGFSTATNTTQVCGAGYSPGQETPWIYANEYISSALITAIAADGSYNVAVKSQVMSPQQKEYQAQLIGGANSYQWLKWNFAQSKSIVNSQHGVQSTYAPMYTPLGRLNTYVNTPGTPFTDANVLTGSGVYNGAVQGLQVPFTYGATFSSYAVIAPMYPTLRILNGVPNTLSRVGAFLDDNSSLNDQYGCVTKKKFYVPILSGIVGQLIPKSQWRLIPGKGTGLMTFEWTLNQYAFFASGINDAAFNTGGVTINGWTDAQIQANQYKIKWSVTSISMWFDLWWFDDMVTNTVDQQLMGDGIIITSQGATLGPMYTISNTPSVTNTWHINNGILSLRTVMFYFLLNDYQRYSFLRKHFRISHNLANMQLKVGTDFIPQTPIQGHAGNLECNSVIPYDCTQFYVELLRTFNHFFHADSNFSIHPTNYVLNDRLWDFNGAKGNFGQDLFGQQAFYHETRAVGKALYAFDLLADPYDHSVLSGLDTTKVRPIELVLQATSDQVNNGDQTRTSTMYIWLLHDILVNFKMGQMEAAGYG